MKETCCETSGPLFVVQTNHVSIGCFVMDLDRRVVSTFATTPSQVRNNLIGTRLDDRSRRGITGEFKLRELKMVRPATAEPGAAPALA